MLNITGKKISIVTTIGCNGIMCNYLLKQIYKDQVVNRQFHQRGKDDFLDSIKDNNEIDTLIYADCFPKMLFRQSKLPALNNVKRIIIFDSCIFSYNLFNKFIKAYISTKKIIGGIMYIDVKIDDIVITYIFTNKYLTIGVIYTLFHILEPEFLRGVIVDELWQYKSRDNYFFSIGIKNKIKEINYKPNKNLDKYIEVFTYSVEQYIKDGQALYNTIDHIVDNRIKLGNYLITKDKFGNTVFICDFKTVDINTQLQIIYTKYTNIDYVLSYNCNMLNNNVTAVLRSRKSGGNCSIIASEMGGGGYYNAASFNCTITQFYDFFPALRKDDYYIFNRDGG